MGDYGVYTKTGSGRLGISHKCIQFSGRQDERIVGTYNFELSRHLGQGYGNDFASPQRLTIDL